MMREEEEEEKKDVVCDIEMGGAMRRLLFVERCSLYFPYLPFFWLLTNNELIQRYFNGLKLCKKCNKDRDKYVEFTSI